MPDRSGPGITTAAPFFGSSRGDGEKCATGGEARAKAGEGGGEPLKRKVAKEETVIGTWNVRTLKQSGKMEVLVNEMECVKWNILGISEMRWKGIGVGNTEDGHKFWYSGNENKHIRGVGFLVNKDIKRTIIECIPVNERIIAIRVNGTPLNMSIVQVYAPTSDSSEEELEAFYEDLENLLKKVPRKDILVVQGDWNAKIGEDAYHDWKGTIGKFGHGTTNDRGMRLLEFAKKNQLTATNTLFRHKESRRTTWLSPDGKTNNQIDYIFVSSRFKTAVNKARTRTFNKPDIGSDHDLVMMTMKAKLKVNKSNKSCRTFFDLEKLKDPEIRREYQTELAGRFAPLLLLDQDSQVLCDQFTNTIEKVAEEKLGRARKIKQPWITTKVLEKCDERREKKRRKNLGEEELQQYRVANKETKNALNEAKNTWIEKQRKDIEECLNHHNTRKAYELVKNLTKSEMENKKPVNVIEDKDGTLLTKSEEVTERWKTYCEELYNYESEKDLEVLNEPVQEDDERKEEEILMSEVESAVKELKVNKSPGADNITAELIQNGGEATLKLIHKLCNSIVRSREWPSQWTESVLIVIPKKANSKKCADHRTISLISHASKVLLKIIQKRITPRIEEVLSETQAGFRKRRSTTEQIANLRILNEKIRDAGQVIFHNFIDFRKAFDRVWQDAMWHTMNKGNIGKEITELVKNLYESARSKVLISDQYSDWFETKVGVRQGCLLSPTLFNLFLERIMTDALENYQGGVKCAGRRVTDLRYADDIDLMAESEEGIQELTKRLEEASRKYGMEISTEKSKVMVVGKRENIDNHQHIKVSVDSKELEQVQSFTYLGSTIDESGDSEKEIRIRIGRATSALVKLEKTWKAKNITLKNKILLMKSLVESTLLYACESWTIIKKMEKKIGAFEMKCYRRLLGISWKEKKTNDFVRRELNRICGFNPEPLVEIAKRRKLKYFGHVVRGGGMAKEVMEGKIEGSRGRGRPKRNWISDVVEWSGCSAEELSRKTRDRAEWRSEVRNWVHPRPDPG